MAQSFLHLVYHSIPTAHFRPDHLSDILASASTKNLQNQITGFLIFRDNRFIQLLEGPESSVLATMAKIRTDKRHRSLKVLGTASSPERIAPDWSMALLDQEANSTSADSVFELLDLGGGGQTIDLKSSLETLIKILSRSTRKLNK